jgi:transcriptional regulator
MTVELLTTNTPQMATAIDIFNKHPFATLLLGKKHSLMPQISHIPLFFDPQQHCFYAHLAANNPMVALINDGQQQAKVIFTAEHGYVSPTWSEHIKVPTWDYCVVHVSGQVEIIEKEPEQQMIKQIAIFENDWQITTLSDNLKQQLLKSIRVIRINISEMRYKYKMSQAKPVTVQSAIVQQLSAKGKHALVSQYKMFFDY